MVAVAVLVKGYADVGDGFAAGVIAALGRAAPVPGLRPGRGRAGAAGPRRAAQLAIGGLLVALAVAFVPVAGRRAPLQHAPAPGAEVVHLGSLELLTAVAFDVGVFALVLGMSVADPST